MRTIPACWRTLAAGAVLALALSPALAAPAGPTAPDKDAAVNPVEKLRKDLDKPITIKIDKQSLTAAIEALRDKSKINIVLDGMTIQQQLGFVPDQPPVPVAVDLKDASVRTVLRTILSPYGLSYAPIGDTVVVTTDDMAMMRQLRQRISVDLDKAEFAAALKQISRDTAVNLILDARVEKQAATKVSLRLEDVPLETVVRLLSEMAGLKPVRVGNVLFVTSKENANQMRNDPDIAQPNPNVQLQEISARQQQFLIQAQLGTVPGQVIGPQVGNGVIAAPPGIAPVLPPTVPTVPPIDKESKTDAPKPDDSKSGDETKGAKDPPPPDVKPLTK